MMQWVLIFEMTQAAAVNFENKKGIFWINHLRDFTEAWVKPLEFLYPQWAYCKQGGLDIASTSYNIGALFYYRNQQIVYNIVRKLGTISYSFITFWDCF